MTLGGTGGGPPPPGWYPDPYYPASTRYWDGSSWTAHAQGSGYAHLGAPGPVLDLPGARSAAERATKGFVVQAVVNTTMALLYPLLVSTLFDTIREADPATANSTLPGRFVLLSLVAQPLGLITLVALIFVAIWSQKATSNANALGRSTTHTPGWALAGWFVPVLSLWYPYLAVRDLLPEGHPLRARAGWWWALSIGGQVTIVVPVAISFASVMAAEVTALVPVACFLAAASIAIRIVAAVPDSQEEAARQQGAASVSPG